MNEITPQTATFHVRGTTPFFAPNMTMTCVLKRHRHQRDVYRSHDGRWHGIPPGLFRRALGTAARFIFVESDGVNARGDPLAKIVGGEPVVHETEVRCATGTDVIRRLMWCQWELKLRVTFDANQFSLSDVSSLLERAGQIGIGLRHEPGTFAVQ